MRRTFVTLMALAALGAAGAAQSGKKVFISADMEGISGISASDQLSAAGAEYGRSRKMMADDVNAAIRGARGVGPRRSSSTTLTAPCAISASRIWIPTSA